MDKQIKTALYNKAKQWVLEAGSNIRDKINDPLIVDTKSNPNDLVTTMDKETEQYFAKKIKAQYPDHLLFGEEGYGDDVTSLAGTVWIVDPIDGTMNFVHQKRNFAISVGIYHDGIGEVGLIYNVMADELYCAKRNEGAYKNGVKLPSLKKDLILDEAILGLNHFWLCDNHVVDEQVMQQLIQTVRGTRTYGSAALEFAYVAEGILDGYLAKRLSPWDVAAGQVIVNEVGGLTTDIEGKPINLLENSSVLTCNKQIHKLIVTHITNQKK